MKVRQLIFIACFIAFTCQRTEAQIDSAVVAIQRIPFSYISNVDRKISKYSIRLTNKTEKTLIKLVRWETKIHELLLRVNPAAAERLFRNDQLTFAIVLEKFRAGEKIVSEQRARYDEYRDKLTVGIKYLEEKNSQIKSSFVQPIKNAKAKLSKLEDEQATTEAITQFIKERKKELLSQSLQFLGNSKYLQKIDKESYYYVETLRNYKDIFSDEQKAEKVAFDILNKIPAFQQFFRENSMLTSLFGNPLDPSSAGNLTGLQTRSSISQLIQGQLAAAGPNAQSMLQQNVQAAQNMLNSLKDKVQKAGGSTGDMELPNFKPVEAKSRTFKQRLEFNNNFQFTKNNSLVPTQANIGLSVGYKLNDKSTIGVGGSYNMGIGDIQHIHFSHMGLSVRSFVDWKLKSEFYFSGGFEMNHNAGFRSIEQLRNYNEWQGSGLLGLSKKINLKAKLIKGSKISIMYDALARRQVPVANPWVLRTGYNF
jgi:hypothetical protein